MLSFCILLKEVRLVTEIKSNSVALILMFVIRMNPVYRQVLFKLFLIDFIVIDW